MFDSYDSLLPYQYARFELINRIITNSLFRGAQRAFLFQLSHQHNFRSFPNAIDPSYQNTEGPIELFSTLQMGAFAGQIQANYPLLLNQGVREYDWSSSLYFVFVVG